MDGLVQPGIWLDCDAPALAVVTGAVSSQPLAPCRLPTLDERLSAARASLQQSYAAGAPQLSSTEESSLIDSLTHGYCYTPWSWREWMFRGLSARPYSFTDDEHLAVSGQPLPQSVDARILDLISEG